MAHQLHKLPGQDTVLEERADLEDVGASNELITDHDLENCLHYHIMDK